MFITIPRTRTAGDSESSPLFGWDYRGAGYDGPQQSRGASGSSRSSDLGSDIQGDEDSLPPMVAQGQPPTFSSASRTRSNPINRD